MPALKLKFSLPVGAVIGGLRHIGGGEFVGHALPEDVSDWRGKSGVKSRVPVILECFSACHDAPTGVRMIPTEVYADPLDDADQVGMHLVLLEWPGGVTEAAFAAEHGVSPRDLREAVASDGDAC